MSILPHPPGTEDETGRNLTALAAALPTAQNTAGNAWLKLALPGNHVAAFGSGTVTFPGASARSGAQTVTHGLGATPVTIQVTFRRPAGTPSLIDSIEDPAPDGTSFAVSGITQDGSTPTVGTTRTFYWLAIG